MAGQLWTEADRGGYMYTDELSDMLRTNLQPMTRFRQLCDAKDGTMKGLNRGQSFTWNVYSNVATQGRDLQETQPMPETGFTIAQGSATVVEAGNSVPYTGLLEDLAKHDVVSIIDKQLKHDARKYFDIKAFTQFKRCLLRAAPASSGTSLTSVTLVEDGIPTITNNVALGTGHIKALSDEMRERDIPPYLEDDYVAISHPTTWRPFKNELEDIHQYTEAGLNRILAGEIGRYEGIRFVTQNFIPKGGAYDSTTFDPYTRTADAWNNGLSSWAFFMGADTVTEGICIPEEIRAKLPGDYGRSGGIAWYYLGAFGLIHRNTSDPDQGRILMWDSAA
jgi:N4-gp56 family major capsid protein